MGLSFDTVLWAFYAEACTRIRTVCSEFLHIFGFLCKIFGLAWWLGSWSETSHSNTSIPTPANAGTSKRYAGEREIASANIHACGVLRIDRSCFPHPSYEFNFSNRTVLRSSSVL